MMDLKEAREEACSLRERHQKTKEAFPFQLVSTASRAALRLLPRRHDLFIVVFSASSP